MVLVAYALCLCSPQSVAAQGDTSPSNVAIVVGTLHPLCQALLAELGALELTIERHPVNNIEEQIDNLRGSAPAVVYCENSGVIRVWGRRDTPTIWHASPDSDPAVVASEYIRALTLTHAVETSANAEQANSQPENATQPDEATLEAQTQMQTQPPETQGDERQGESEIVDLSDSGQQENTNTEIPDTQPDGARRAYVGVQITIGGNFGAGPLSNEARLGIATGVIFPKGHAIWVGTTLQLTNPNRGIYQFALHTFELSGRVAFAQVGRLAFAAEGFFGASLSSVKTQGTDYAANGTRWFGQIGAGLHAQLSVTPQVAFILSARGGLLFRKPTITFYTTTLAELGNLQLYLSAGVELRL